MRKVLVFVQDAQFFLFIRYVLASEGFDAMPGNPTSAPDATQTHPDIAAIVVEWPPRNESENNEPARLKRFFPDAAMILVSRNGEPPNELRLQSDLVLHKPFKPGSLIDFLRHLRHGVKKQADPRLTTLVFGDLRLSAASMTVERADTTFGLTTLQFRLLRHLLLRSPAVCSRDELIARCWPEHAEVEPRTVDVHIGGIRRSLGLTGSDIIRTVRGSGYVLKRPDDDDDDTPVSS